MYGMKELRDLHARAHALYEALPEGGMRQLLGGDDGLLGVIWDEIKAKEEDEARAERHLWRLNFDGRVSKGLAALRALGVDLQMPEESDKPSVKLPPLDSRVVSTVEIRSGSILVPTGTAGVDRSSVFLPGRLDSIIEDGLAEEWHDEEPIRVVTGLEDRLDTLIHLLREVLEMQERWTGRTS